MAHTYKTDPWHVKEARGVAWHPTQFAREHSPYTKARRDLSKRIRARERREMERIARDLEAWGDYFPTDETTGDSLVGIYADCEEDAIKYYTENYM